MVELELKVEELDKMELYGGVEVETYKRHTKKLLDLAKHTKIDTGIVNMVFVQDKLPEVIKDKVDKSHANWLMFCAAIEVVNKAYIRDSVKKHREQEAKFDLLNSQLSHVKCLCPENTVSAITAQLGHTNLNSQQAVQANQLTHQFTQAQTEYITLPHQFWSDSGYSDQNSWNPQILVDFFCM